jgi:dTDP-6-deoxy-L-talose 4-dehydrogenase (NAD+)
MKVLVTGATGGIGSLIVDEVLRAGHQVIAVSRDSSKAEDLAKKAGVTYIPFDFADTGKENLFTYFQKPDVLIHPAWEKLNDFKNQEHLDVILKNHQAFIKNLIENGLKHVNGVGTCYECGLHEGLVTEETPGAATLPYAEAKDRLRKFTADLCEKNNVVYKWIRIFYVFGEVKGRKNLYTLLHEAVNKGEEQFNMSGGEQVRDFLSPSEIASYITRISLQKEVTGVINCCSGKPVKLKDFIQQYVQNNHMNIRLNLGFYPYPDYEPMQTWGSTVKLDKILKQDKKY